MRCRGQSPRFMASEKMVKEPESRAWLAMMAAPVLIITPGITIHEGMMV